MTGSAEDRVGAIRRITDAAAAVAANASLVKPLIASTGLSREGVKFALAEYLETYPSDEEIRAMVRRAPTARRVHVVLSASVFTAPLRAIAWARAIAPTVSVSVSSREPVFGSALLEAIADPAIFPADREILDDLVSGDEVHVYGRAETIESIRARVLPGVVVRAHGPGFGIALLKGEDDFDKLAEDVIAFDQRGCLSPRIAFFETDGDSIGEEAFAACIASALESVSVPRGALSSLEASDATRYIETLRFVGGVDIGKDFAVGISEKVILPPTGRHLHVVPVSDWGAVEPLLGSLASLVTIVGSNEREIASFLPDGVRLSPLGKMQRPPFDGPVDLRVPG